MTTLKTTANNSLPETLLFPFQTSQSKSIVPLPNLTGIGERLQFKTLGLLGNGSRKVSEDTGHLQIHSLQLKPFKKAQEDTTILKDQCEKEKLKVSKN